MRSHIYLPDDAEQILVHMARDRGASRSQVLTDLLRLAARERTALDWIDLRLDRIEAMLREGPVAASPAPAATPPQGETDADRSMALLRAWGARDDEDD